MFNKLVAMPFAALAPNGLFGCERERDVADPCCISFTCPSFEVLSAMRFEVLASIGRKAGSRYISAGGRV